MPPAPLLGVQRTLFLPLIVRAQAPALCPLMDPADAQAARVLQASGENPMDYPMDSATVVNILWRTQLIREIATDFFGRYPRAQGVNLGAGLADYFQWLDNGRNRWLDVDLPEVVDWRQSLLPEPPARCQTRASDFSQPGWWQRLGLPPQHHPQPLLIVTEGVLMYMQPTQVKALLQEIGNHAPEGSELVCDFISPMGIGHTVPANHHGQDQAPFSWGAHNGQEIASLHPRLELLAQHSVSEAWGWGAGWLDMFLTPLTGGPLYGVAHLKVSDDL